MLLGKKNGFAIECIHEPNYPDDRRIVYGRMCVWCHGVALGDLAETDCILNTVACAFRECLGRLDELQDESIDELSDEEAFGFLDDVLYLDNELSDQQIHAASQRFSKFVFLTNWGETFDGCKAFMAKRDQAFRILYRLPSDEMGAVKVTRADLVGSIQAFLDWMEDEQSMVPIA